MPYRIPNVADAAYNAQARVFSSNFNDLAGGISGAGVLSGCVVTPGSGTLELDVSAGVAVMAQDGLRTVVDATTVTLSQNPSGQNGNNARIDVIQANATTGVVDINEGTISSEPVEPDVNTDCVKLAAVYVPPDTETVTEDMLSDRRILVYTADTAISKALVNSSYMAASINDGSEITGHNFTDLNEMTFPYTSPVLFQTKNTFDNGDAFLFVCQMVLGAFLMNPHTDTYGLAPGFQYSIDFAEAGDPAPTPGNWRTAPFAAYAINYTATSDFPWFQALPPFLLTIQFDAEGGTDVVDYTTLADPFSEVNTVDPSWSSVEMWTSFRWSIPTSGQIFTAGTDYPVGDTAVSNVGLQAVSQLFGSSTVTRPVYVDPDITGLDPATGVEAGGTAVTITGTGFAAATDVTFDGEPATSVVVVSDTEITCVSPAGTGAAQVVVSAPFAVSSGFTFTYT